MTLERILLYVISADTSEIENATSAGYPLTVEMTDEQIDDAIAYLASVRRREFGPGSEGE